MARKNAQLVEEDTGVAADGVVETPAAAQHDEVAPEDVSTLARYLREVSAHALLTPEEELARARQIQEKTAAAWQAALEDRALASPVLRAVADAIELDEDTVKTLRGARRKDAAETLRALDRDGAGIRAAIAVLEGRAPEHAQRVRALRRDAERAIAAFAQANLRLVVSLTRHYAGGHLTKLDLIQEGNLGLLRAVERFDPNRGVKFCTYAGWWINAAIRRAVRNRARTVRVPIHVLEVRAAVRRVERRLRAAGTEPTVAALVEATGMSEEAVQRALRVHDDSLSLDARTGGEDDTAAFVDLLVDEAPLVEERMCREDTDELYALRQAWSDLTPRERDVLRLRFFYDHGEGVTLEEAGIQIESTQPSRQGDRVCRERVRQIEKRALTKLRSQIDRFLRQRRAG